MSFDPQDRAEIEEAGEDARRWASNERILVAFRPRGLGGAEPLTA
jgi:hypothetical protein